MRVSVTGVGWVGSLGPGRAGDVTSPKFVGGTPAKVRLKDYFANAEGRSGRLDDYSKLGLAAVALALDDAGLAQWEHKRPGALVSATGYGCLAVDGRYFETALPEGGALASPNLFAYTLPNCFVGEAVLRFALTGPTFVVSAPTAGGGGLKALTEGVALVIEGEASFAVCGSCELGVPDFLTEQDEYPCGAVFFVIEDAATGKADTQIGTQVGASADTQTGAPLATLTLRGNELIHEGFGPVEDLTQFIYSICKRNKS